MKNTKTPLVLWAATVLLVVTMLTSHICSGVFARYTVNGSATASVSVAKFSVSSLINGQATLEDLVIVPGQTKELDITISNDSEVDVMVDISANSNGVLPLTWNTVSEELAQGAEKTYTLVIEWDESDNSYTYSTEIDHLTVTISCKQIINN